MYLILAPTPEVRKWPFYGQALTVLNQELRMSLPPPGHDRAAWDEKNIEHFRHQLESHLADARRVVAMLETDLKAVNEAFPKPKEEGDSNEAVRHCSDSDPPVRRDGPGG